MPPTVRLHQHRIRGGSGWAESDADEDPLARLAAGASGPPVCLPAAVQSDKHACSTAKCAACSQGQRRLPQRPICAANAPYALVRGQRWTAAGLASVRTWGGHIPGVALRQQLIEVVQVHKVVELPVCNKTVSAQLRNRPSPFAPSPSLRFVSLTPCLSLSRELSLSRSSSSLSLSLSLSLVLSLSRCASARAHTHTLALSRQASLSVSLALARVSTIVRVAYFGRQ